MDLTVNGKEFSITEDANILDLLSVRGVDPAVVIIEVNRTIIKNNAFGSHHLRAGDTVEILRFVGGG